MFKSGSRRHLLVALSLVGTVMTAIVVLVGAWTRLTDAGLGCPDWPGCYGRLVVPDAGVAQAHTPDSPLEPFKAWVEMFHRYIASLLGVIVLALVMLGRSRRNDAGYPWGVSLALLMAIVVQGAFGAFTVTLKLWPQVVTLHLLGGLAVMGLFLWLHLRLRRYARSISKEGEGIVSAPRRLSRWWAVAIALLVAQLALGGWTSSNYAGMACQGFPTCNGEWWPSMDWSEGFHLTQTVGPNYLYGQLHADARSAIHMGHRLGALALGITLLMLIWRHWGVRQLRPILLLLFAVYGGQVLIGALNVIWWLPLSLALVHTAGALLMVAMMVLAVWQARGIGQPGRSSAMGECVNA
ncbi:cytochrome c oxidase assembly protein subunit 15 [Aidingimonas halophila]|uniref:Cytochrome c oxidase assembly protein subunit 15 n=1 Tax=Aidingimonas halophila TaxID=574349 RepID=A0A1H3BY30_9GAMM|nr:COX15/CtaA family protein [Aidingimonas halophila]GHC27316.1 heme A synthase [Aidingimonas halophila]SDX46783.1 cytochrome c oxidase assembly protein subunit 15 [Aidingimonas halophila]